MSRHHASHQGRGHHQDSTHLDWNLLAPLLELQAEIASPAHADAAARLGTLAPV
ncbi:hypothetical protein [Streptomyces sp. NPDC096068]|uniref:hypothetical protein n=1 Tax=Streptomyces sp. NPDC096068 TaxID=3155424 RepID=UPI00332C33D3